MLNCSCHRPAMLQKATISTLCLPSVRPTAVVAGSCRKRCVRAFASASQDRHEQLHSSIDSTASSNRRQLLAGTVAAAIGPVLLGAATAAAAVAPAAEAVSASATVASAATPVQSRANSTYQIVTEEGTVRLFTNDQVAKNMTPTDRQVFALNRRVQAQNRTPDDFPGFIRQGFDITVVGEGYVMDQNGLVYKDFVEGSGSNPTDGQQVVFDYTGYNESGAIIDSSYRKGRPAETRIGIQGLIPGFELGVKSMKPGGKRRIVVPPALGPPVGPSTFFSAKQCEVFDVELRAVKNCERRQMMMFSDVVCE